MNPIDFTDPNDVVGYVKALLESNRLPCTDEYKLQKEAAEIFHSGGLKYYPEFLLEKRDRIDFFFPDSKVGLECKVKADGGNTNRQLLRYAMTKKVKHLILLTSRPHQSLPPSFEVEGETIPVTVVQIATL